MEKDLWKIGLDSWIIQDGNYPDFQKGQIAEFALEFFTNSTQVVRTQTKELSATLLKDYLYKVNAKVVYRDESFTFIDIGDLLAYGYVPNEFVVGDTFSAEIYLTIDCFQYFESAPKFPTRPPLIYTWNVQKIIKTTRFSKTEIILENHIEIEQTDAWSAKTDEGYILICEKQNLLPKRAREIA